jgi:tetratricopeptide (TPR) repeat protein
MSVFLCAVRRTALVVALVACSHAVAPPASAQHRLVRPSGTPSAEALRQARDLFVAGSAAVEAGRWADALDKFDRAYALSGVAAALYNAATALRSLGRHRDAREAFDLLLTAHPEIDAALRAESLARREEEAARVVVLALAGIPERVTVEVQLDGVAVRDEGRRPFEVQSDAGQRALRVDARDYEPWRWQGRVQDGQYVTLQVDLRRTPPRSTPSSVFSSPWFWVAVGTAVLAAGAAVTGYVVYQDSLLEPQSPNVVDLR